MSVADTERAKLLRTPQDLVVLGVRYCANWYAQIVQTDAYASEDFSHVTLWTRSGCTVTANTHEAPNKTTSADTLAFAAAGDSIRNTSSSFLAASKAFTASVFLRSISGAGTITLRLRDGTNTEHTDLQVALTTTWLRFDHHHLFGAGAGGGVAFEIRREAGDLASVVAWGANCSQNPLPLDKSILFPYKPTSGSAVNVSSCAAADAGDGARCFYSSATCQDPANFNSGNTYEPLPLNGIREFKFCRTEGPHPLPGQDIRPLVQDIQYNDQKIDAERSVTTTDHRTITFEDDASPGVWDIPKAGAGAKINTQRGQGTFWRRFSAIFRHYSNPEGYAIHKEGFVAAGMTEALYIPTIKGVMENLEIQGDGTVTLHLRDRLSLTRKNIFGGISQDNLLTAAMDGSQLYVDVNDASEVTPPAYNAASASPDYIVTILIQSEEMNVTSVDLSLNRLTVQRGRWGTSAVAHANSLAWTEIAEFGTERTTPANPPIGKNPIDCVIELLCRAGLPKVEIDTTRLFDERDTWLVTSVDTTAGTETGPTFRRTIIDQLEIEKGLQQIREATQLFLWTDEDSLTVTGRLFAPARPTETLVELTDDANFIIDSISIDDNQESRITEVLVAWGIIPGASGDTPIDYIHTLRRIGADEENRNGYGDVRLRTILSEWIRSADSTTPNSLAKRTLSRYRHGARLIRYSLERKDGTLRVGDFAKISTSRLQKPDGSIDSGRVVMVTSKRRVGLNRYDYEALDTGLFKRYWFWAPSGQADYDAASAQEKRYAYWGTLVTPDRAVVGAAADDGYYFWQ